MKKRIAMLLIMAGVIVGGTCVSAEAQENETWNIWVFRGVDNLESRLPDRNLQQDKA